MICHCCSTCLGNWGSSLEFSEQQQQKNEEKNIRYGDDSWKTRSLAIES